MNYQRSPSCHNFQTLTLFSYHSMVTPLGAFHAETIGEAVFLFVFRIALPAKVSKTRKHHQPSQGRFWIAREHFGQNVTLFCRILQFFVTYTFNCAHEPTSKTLLLFRDTRLSHLISLGSELYQLLF